MSSRRSALRSRSWRVQPPLNECALLAPAGNVRTLLGSAVRAAENSIAPVCADARGRAPSRARRDGRIFSGAHLTRLSRFQAVWQLRSRPSRNPSDRLPLSLTAAKGGQEDCCAAVQDRGGTLQRRGVVRVRPGPSYVVFHIDRVRFPWTLGLRVIAVVENQQLYVMK